MQILYGDISGEKYLDCKELFNYGFNNYTRKQIVNEGDIVDTIKIKGATPDTKSLDLQAEKSIFVLTKNNTSEDEFNPEIILKQNLIAPLNKGEIVRNSYI